MSFGKMECNAIAKADGPYHQEWQGMQERMNALRLPAFENLGCSSVILTGGGSFRHKAWKQKADQFARPGRRSLCDGVFFTFLTRLEAGSH